MTLLALWLNPGDAQAAANFLYHERSLEDVTQGAVEANCDGPLPYVDKLIPSSDEPYVLRVRLEYQSSTDNLRVYFTTDGTDPLGGFGQPSSGTQVAMGFYQCQVTDAGQIVEIGEASIPPQSPGTLVRYIIGAWDSAGGVEIFANGGTCATCNQWTNAAQADVFSYLVGSAPLITDGLLDMLVAEGDPISLTANVVGTAPLQYQWFLGGQPIPEATNAVYTIGAAQLSDTGAYSFRVSNEFGAEVSEEAQVTVLTPPAIVTQPADLLINSGTTALFTVEATGSDPLTYQWFFNQTNALLNATNSDLVITNVQMSHEGGYRVVVSNPVGNTASQEAQLALLVPPTITTQPFDRNIGQGFTVSFGVNAIGSMPIRYQWRKDGIDLPGRTNRIFTITDAQPSDEGFYSVIVENDAGIAFSRAARLQVILLPVILEQPMSLTATQGFAASFQVTADGSGPFTYQWYFNETNLLVGATNAFLTLTQTVVADAGAYRVEVANSVGMATSDDALLTVLPAPLILSQPVSRVVALNEAVSFVVEATGDPELHYQWRKNGVDLVGETNAVLDITAASESDEGGYDVVVTNAYGLVNSQVALLEIEDPPRIAVQPLDLTVEAGQEAVLEVVAGGTPPLLFQWYRHPGELIPGATNAVLRFDEVPVSASGSYYVRISNRAGIVESLQADLVVLGPPFILSGPLEVVTTNTEPASLSVAVLGPGPMSFQWYFQGTNQLTAATNTNFTLAQASPSDAGLYHVEVSNTYGTTVSQPVVLAVRTEDFGDAPDPSYPVSRANQGARHLLVDGFFLGTQVDFENDGQPHPTAQGDDGAGDDDEDGVSFDASIALGQTIPLTVQASTNGFLNAWIDWDGNGNWGGAAEKVLAGVDLVAGANMLMIDVPPSAMLGQTMARFRFSSQEDLTFSGPAPDGEVEDYAVTVEPAFDLEVSIVGQPNEIGIGQSVQYTVTVRNGGPNAAPQVLLSNPLPRTANLASANASQGSCGENAGVLECQLGALNVNATATISFSLNALSAGSLIQVPHASSPGFEIDPGDNQATLRTPVTYPIAPSFNNDDIAMPEYLIGPGTVYPSPIPISGQTSTVHKVTVTINEMNHVFPDDFDILLVGPQGQNVLLMSDVGSGIFTPISDVTLTFDDAAGAPLDDTDQIVSGTYQPSNSGRIAPEHDNFFPPAPGKPYGAALSVFRDTDPNGDWLLYIMDDSPEYTGYVGGWSLQLTLADPMADLGMGLVDRPDPVALTSNVTYTVGLTNFGPSRATGIVMQGAVPEGTQYVSGSASHAGCRENGGILLCDLGDLAPGQAMTVAYAVTAMEPGWVTNVVEVSCDQVDFNAANDVGVTATFVNLINDLSLGAVVSPDPVLLGQPLTYVFSVTNHGPYAAEGVVLTNLLPAKVQFESATAMSGDCLEMGGIVRCDLGNLAVGQGTQVNISGRALDIGMITNVAFVGSDQSDTDIFNNIQETVSAIVPAVDLVVQQVDNQDPIVVGGSVVYSLVVSNQGPSSADTVAVASRMPWNSTFMNAVASQGTCSNVESMVYCDLGALSVGTSALVDIQVLPSSSGIASNLVQVLSEHGDPNPDDNFSTEYTVVDPAADIVLQVIDRPDSVQVASTLEYSLMVSNAGPDTASELTLHDLLPLEATFLSVQPSQGTCTNDESGLVCDLGVLDSQAVAIVSVNVIPNITGSMTNVANVQALEFDPDLSNNVAEAITTVLIEAGAFANDEFIELPDAGVPMSYPSTIEVSGVTSRVDRVSVTLHGLNHSYADDLDFLLVGPDGQSAMLWSDVGGGSALENLTVTLDRFANTELPDDGPITSGHYRPTDFDPDSDEFPEPAPPAPYSADLSGFEGTDVNGTWSLFIRDDFPKDGGYIERGWSLSFGTTEVLNDLSVVLSTRPMPVAVGSNLTYAVEVTNQGPGIATGVELISSIPANVDSVSVANSSGTCTNVSDRILCDLGSLLVGAVTTVEMTVRPREVGTLVFSSSVSGREIDVAFGNNSGFTVVEVENAPALTVQPFSMIVTNGAVARFQVLATGSSPLQYQWYHDGVPLAGQTEPKLTIPAASVGDEGQYTVKVENRSGAVTSDPARLTVLLPATIVRSPVNQTAYTGGQVQFEVVATGSAPLTYQWFFKGALMSGRTNAVLSLTNLVTQDAGNYQVRVGNALNSIAAQPVTLTVLTADFGDAPALVTSFPTRLQNNGARHVIVPGSFLGKLIDAEPDGQPTSQADGDDIAGIDDDDGVTFLTTLVPGVEVTVQVVASRSGFLDAWVDFDGNSAWEGEDEQIFSSAALETGTNVLVFPVPDDALASEAAHARFRFSSSGGLQPFGLASDGEVEDYAVPVVRRADVAITMVDSPRPGTVNFNLVYQIGVTNQGPLPATSVRAQAGVPQGTFLIGLSSSRGACSTSPFPNCDLGDLAAGQGALMTVIVIPLNEGVFTNSASVSSLVEDPNPDNNTSSTVSTVLRRALIVEPPSSQVAILGETASFSVQATGSGLRYQWRFNDVALPGETNASLVLPSVQMADEGSYSVMVSNVLNSVLSASANLTVVVPPAFVLHPVDQAVAYGGNVAFEGLAQGTEPIVYQWFRDGATLIGETNTSLMLSDLQPFQAGVYTLSARNAGGEVISDPAKLTLNGVPIIVEHPSSQTNFAGSTAIFRVRAAGTEPLSIQWYFNDTNPLADQTNATLVIPDVQLVDRGTIHALVTNDDGMAVSEAAVLEVIEADFGDAPDPLYATLAARQGAWHRIAEGVFLGATVDFEADGQPTVSSQGDDMNGVDDEDGVFFSQPWPVGEIVSIDVVAATNGLLSAWVDFNGNGSWADTGDRIFSDQLLQPGTNKLNALVPSSAIARNTFARFRFSTAGGLSATGPAPDGEVEDYAVILQQRSDLRLTSTVSSNPAGVGNGTRITLNLFNLGPAFSTGISLTNRLPANFALANITSSQGTCTNLDGTVVCAVGVIAGGQTASVMLDGVATVAGTYVNTSQVAAVEFDANLMNNSSVLQFEALDLPVLVQEPASLTVTNGTMTTLTALAQGSAPLRYQWYFNGAMLSGQTNASLSFDSVQATDEGEYFVRVSNPVGLVDSGIITLDVKNRAAILQPPVDTFALAGSTARLTVVATGDAPISYQWFREEAPLSEGTNAMLILPNVRTNDSGAYRVEVRNDINSISSDLITLTVRQADFGDAPEPGYRTMLADNGAYHLIVPGVNLGNRIDFEPDGLPHPLAAGDDSNGVDDEDGVLLFTSLQSGQSASARVSVSVPGFLNAWMDFNLDGDWEDEAEQIFVDRPLVAGPNVVTFVLPSDVRAGTSFARFRFSTAGGDGIGGMAMDGEVEDYLVRFTSSSDLAVTGFSTPAFASVGASVFTSLTVTNQGPGDAAQVVLGDFLPAGWQVQSILVSQGACVHDANLIACDLGMIAAGSVAQALVEAIPTSEGVFEQQLNVSSAVPDLNPADNTFIVQTVVQTLPLIVRQPRSQGVQPGDSVSLEVEVLGAGPLQFQWRKDGVEILGETSSRLVIGDVQSEDLGVYDVEVSNPNGMVLSLPAELYQAGPPIATTLPVEDVGSDRATLRAEITPNGLLTVVWFEWGETTNYTAVTAPGPAGPGNLPVEFDTVARGLASETEYHYRVVATNALGLVVGEDQVLTTTAVAPLITSITRAPDGTVRIEFLAPEGRPFEIRATQDLETWVSLGLATDLGGGFYDFVDVDGPNFDYRFYQVFLP